MRKRIERSGQKEVQRKEYVFQRNEYLCLDGCECCGDTGISALAKACVVSALGCVSGDLVFGFSVSSRP